MFLLFGKERAVGYVLFFHCTEPAVFSPRTLSEGFYEGLGVYIFLVDKDADTVEVEQSEMVALFHLH